MSLAEHQATTKSPTRTCVGCGRKDDAPALVRLVLGPDEKSVAVDLAGGSFGRGAHVHPRPDCIKKAAKGGLARSFKRGVVTSAEEIAKQIFVGCERRIQGLLMGGRRARALAVGHDLAEQALQAGAPLVVVTADAGSVVRRGPVAKAIREGHAIVFGTKETLSPLVGAADKEIAVVAVKDSGIAAALSQARAMADTIKERCLGCRSEAR